MRGAQPSIVDEAANACAGQGGAAAVDALYLGDSKAMHLAETPDGTGNARAVSPKRRLGRHHDRGQVATVAQPTQEFVWRDPSTGETRANIFDASMPPEPRSVDTGVARNEGIVVKALS